jgi:hypothetical protein
MHAAPRAVGPALWRRAKGRELQSASDSDSDHHSQRDERGGPITALAKRPAPEWRSGRQSREPHYFGPYIAPHNRRWRFAVEGAPDRRDWAHRTTPVDGESGSWRVRILGDLSRRSGGL